MNNSERKQPKKVKFDVAAIIKKSLKIKEIVDPELGIIRYVILTNKDMAKTA